MSDGHSDDIMMSSDGENYPGHRRRYRKLIGKDYHGAGASRRNMVILIVFITFIGEVRCDCPDLGLDDVLVPSGQNCELSADLHASALTVDGVLIVHFNAKIFVDELTVSNSGHISANGQGFGPGSGPGQGTSTGSGGSHGGRGGRSSSSFLQQIDASCYDDATSPSQMGSPGGGSEGGAGGGVINIVVEGNAEINGLVSANGGPASGNSGGGGSGGSIYINTTYLVGSGRIEANGGRAVGLTGGGGGGGRVAIRGDTSGYHGEIFALGGQPEQKTNGIMESKRITSLDPNRRTVNIAKQFYLTAIRTSGTEAEYVGQYSIAISLDGESPSPYKRLRSDSSAHVFESNSPSVNDTINYLNIPVLAKAVTFDLFARTNPFIIDVQLIGYYPYPETETDIDCGQHSQGAEAGGPGTIYKDEQIVINNLRQSPVVCFTFDTSVCFAK
ncbi:hyphally regulated cell wall protein 1-like [Lytechinus variegatus]|uniref:hyphally regulated cell wall protein 1-like n=1 Tax=Lytechinus variegatus TaxID=7654 RepID=UPI001BB2975C|nr:hyphally regulated cell wall protein 1-like [Lytechinus variegatus]